MFEGVVSYLINRFLGKYVQGLDSSNLRVGIFSDIELKDIHLIPEALVELNLPIEVKAASIDYMRVPWLSLINSSCTAQVDNVNVDVGPVKASLTPTGTPAAPSKGGDPGFLWNHVIKVLKNIKVSVKRVHVCYEDTVTNPEHPFKCDVELKQITKKTCNLDRYSRLGREEEEDVRLFEKAWNDDEPRGQYICIHWSIRFDLHGVFVVLADNGVKRAEIHVKDLRVYAIQLSEKLELVGSLKDIGVKDCTQEALYPNILMLEDKEGSLFEFSFEHDRHPKEHVLENNLSLLNFHYMLRMDVKRVKMVLLGKFYWEIMKFMEPLLSPGVKDTATFTVKSSKKVGSFHEENKRFGISFTIKALTILIPVRSDSHDLLLLEAGYLSVTDVYETTEIMPGSRQECNYRIMTLVDVKLSRARLSKADDTFMIVSHIIEPMAFQTFVRLAMDPVVLDTQTSIDFKSGDWLKCALSVVDGQVLMAILRLNWSEGAVTAEQIGPVRKRPFASKTSQENGSGAMMTSVRFCLEGMHLSLNEDSQAVGVSEIARLVMWKIRVSASPRGDGKTEVTARLGRLTIINTKLNIYDEENKILDFFAFNDTSAVTENDATDCLRVSFIYGDGKTSAVSFKMQPVKVNIQIQYINELYMFFTTAFTSHDSKETDPDGPFVLRPVLVSAEEMPPFIVMPQEVEQLGEEERLTVAGVGVSEHDLKTLADDDWLNDKIINGYLSLLAREMTDMFFMPAQTAEQWTAENFTLFEFSEVDFSIYDLLMLPQCKDNNHWVLLVASVNSRTVTIYDSLCGDNTRLFQLFCKFMSQRAEFVKEGLGEWKFKAPPCNKQSDGKSCGVFVLMTAECLGRKEDPTMLRQHHVSKFRDYVRRRLLSLGVRANYSTVKTRNAANN